MFHEVRIYNSKGDLKKVISEQELSKSYWRTFSKTDPSKLESLILLREYKKRMREVDYHSGNGTYL